MYNMYNERPKHQHEWKIVIRASYYEFTMQYEVVIDHYKKFLDILVGMPGSINDVQILIYSSMYC